MYRGTTPSITCKLDTDIDLSEVTEIYVTFETAYHQVNVGKDDIAISSTDNTLSFTLTEDQTLELRASRDCKVQVRFMLENGMKYATNIQTLTVNDILKDGKIESESE